MNESTLLLSGNLFFAFMMFLLLLLICLLFYCIRLRQDRTKLSIDHKKCLKKLKEHNGFIDQVFKSIPDQLYFKDRQARIVGANPACYLHHGMMSEEALLGKTDIEFKPVSIGKLSYEKELLQMDLNETTRNREEYTLSDGTICHIENIKQPLLDEQGKTIGLVGMSRDISAQVENEQKLIQAQKEAEDANKAKSSFLAMMSHEIRTPMHGIIGAASLLELTTASNEQRDLIHTIESSGENLMAVLNGILDYSKIEAGKVELELIPFILHDCIHDAFDLFVEPANKKGIELLLYTDSNVPEALAGDPTRVRQILLNLIGNAIKFTESGEICVRVKFLPIDDNEDHPHLQFSIRDTGIGISESNQKKLFTAFTQANISSTREYGGTGLGLAICQRLVELMGGSIWLESKENEGSTFSFTIDLPTSSPLKTQHKTPPPNGLTGKRVLLVDDNATNRKILNEQLKSWGAIPFALYDPTTTLEHMETHAPYDLVILDYQMPKMNGVDLAKGIFASEDIKPMPIILLSSSCEDITRHPSISLRMAKPVRIKKLRQNLIDLLSTKEEKEIPSEEKQSISPREKDTTTQILLVEDKLENRNLIQKMIEAVGYSAIQTASDGIEAVLAEKENEYTIILMDIQMPNMNGLDASRAIRKRTQSRKIPWIIGLTAGVTQEEQILMEEAGMNDILPKPMKLEDIQTILAKAKKQITEC